MLQMVFKNKIVKNAGWLISGKIFQMGINFLVGILTARYLGPSNYGLIGYAGAYVAFFTCLCTLGINSVLVKEFIEYPGEEGKILGTSIGLRMASSILSAITMVTISCVVDFGEPLTIAVVALSSIGAVFHVFEVFNYWFQSKLQSKVTAIAAFLAYAITAIYKVILLVLGKDVRYFAFATSVDYICIAIFLYVAYKKHGGGRLNFSSSYGKKLLSKSWHFILPGLMVAIYGQTDKLMLKHLISTSEIGYYSTAVSLCTTWCFVLSAIIDSMVPSIMQAHKDKNPSFEAKNKFLYAIVFYVSCAVSLLFMLFGGWIVRLLYGEAYIPAAAPLRIITWYTAFSYLGTARQAWVVCKNVQKYLIYIYASSALINVILNMLLIPLWGASGAALASLIAQISTIVVPLVIPEMRENTKLMLSAIFLRGLKH